MKRFTTELANATKNANVKNTAVDITKSVTSSNNDKVKDLLLGTKKIAEDIKKTQVGISSPIFRAGKKFIEKHSDESFIKILTKDNDSYYAGSNIDNSKDKIFQELTNLRQILEDPFLLKHPALMSKEIALFYTDQVDHNGENRGNIFNKKCEMFSDKFKENPEFFIENELSTEKLLYFIVVKPSPYEPKIVLHSSLSTADCNSYKHANEGVAALQISAETNNEIFLSGDCEPNDPELLAWIGKLPIKYSDKPIKGQTNVDYYQKVTNIRGENEVIAIVRGELKHRAISVLNSNSQLGANDKSIDLYISAGTTDDSTQNELNTRVVFNTLKVKYSEYSKALQNPKTTQEELNQLKQEIEVLQQNQSGIDKQNYKNITNMYKIIFNKDNIHINPPSELDISSSLSEYEDFTTVVD